MKSIDFSIKKSITKKCIFAIKEDFVTFIRNIQAIYCLCDVWKIFVIKDILSILSGMCVKNTPKKVADEIVRIIQHFCEPLHEDCISDNEFDDTVNEVTDQMVWIIKV